MFLPICVQANYTVLEYWEYDFLFILYTSLMKWKTVYILSVILVRFSILPKIIEVTQSFHHQAYAVCVPRPGRSAPGLGLHTKNPPGPRGPPSFGRVTLISFLLAWPFANISYSTNYGPSVSSLNHVVSYLCLASPEWFIFLRARVVKKNQCSLYYYVFEKYLTDSIKINICMNS